jgi:hypothetical protein
MRSIAGPLERAELTRVILDEDVAVSAPLSVTAGDLFSRRDGQFLGGKAKLAPLRADHTPDLPDPYDPEFQRAHLGGLPKRPDAC